MMPAESRAAATTATIEASNWGIVILSNVAGYSGTSIGAEPWAAFSALKIQTSPPNAPTRVLHLAARVHHPGEEDASEIYRSINTDGTLHLAKAGVGQFIFLITILVNGSSTDGRPPFREEDPVKPRRVYGLSKAAAEIGLETITKETAMGITALRPPLIYGAGALGNFRLLVKAAERGKSRPQRQGMAWISILNRIDRLVRSRSAWQWKHRWIKDPVVL